ncbi:MAG: helix-turn-helix domain-containing protein [Clostridia bacterium]|nr:helix-turn-helix domain-containing protein [Clostridia bacterium]
MEIGKRIRHLRTNKGVTQEDLATALGVSNQAVSRWETGITTPDIYLLPSIALFFGVTIDEIFNPSPEEKLERLRRRFYYTEDHLSDDEFRSALSFLKEQEDVYDDTADIWHLLAQLYLNRIENDKKMVGKYAKKAMRLSADKSFCVRFLTDSEHAVYSDWDTANHSKTISFLKEMVGRFPDEPRYYCALIYNLIADRRVKEAEEYIAEFERRFDKEEFVPIFRARLALADFRKDDAVAIIEKTYRLYPDDEGTVFDIAGFYGEIGEYEKAIEFYQRSYELLESPKMYDALVGVARTYEMIGRYDEAIAAWEKVKENIEKEWGIDEDTQIENVDAEIKRIRGLIGEQV